MFGLWAVCLKNVQMIGDCGLTMQIIHGLIVPEIGYHIRRDQQSKGYAREASCAARDWAFQNTPFNILYAYTKHTNIPSCQTAMSWGCRFVEEYPDNTITRVYALTRTVWAQMARP